ncbi:hypothetical protein D3C86_2236750 [compost metagenome]
MITAAIILFRYDYDLGSEAFQQREIGACRLGIDQDNNAIAFGRANHRKGNPEIAA